jgi:hypothetical protein
LLYKGFDHFGKCAIPLNGYVAINDATAGFNASTDSIVEVTGLTGTLVLGNFVTA